MTFEPPVGSGGYLDDVSMLEFGEVDWKLSGDVMASPAPQWEYGLAGSGPMNLVAGTGMANFVLDNYSTPGKYSPESAAKMSGFEEGMAVKILLRGAEIDPIWDQEADFEQEPQLNLTVLTQLGMQQ